MFLSDDGKEILMDIKQEDDTLKLPVVNKIAMGKRIQLIRKKKRGDIRKIW